MHYTFFSKGSINPLQMNQNKTWIRHWPLIYGFPKTIWRYIRRWQNSNQNIRCGGHCPFTSHKDWALDWFAYDKGFNLVPTQSTNLDEREIESLKERKKNMLKIPPGAVLSFYCQLTVKHKLTDSRGFFTKKWIFAI